MLDIVFIVFLTIYVLQYGKKTGYTISAAACITYLLLLLFHSSEYLEMPRLFHSLFIIAIMLFLTHYISNIREELFKNINTDCLTDTFNRNYIFNNLQQLEYHYSKMTSEAFQDTGLIMLDLNNFKIVNDKKGHQYGDALLKNISARLKDLTRENDIVCRFGGDEFLIMIKGVSPEDLEIIRKRIDQNLSAYLSKTAKQWEINESIGVSIGSAHSSEFDSEDLNLENLIKLSDHRMYRDKSIKKASGSS